MPSSMSSSFATEVVDPIRATPSGRSKSTPIPGDGLAGEFVASACRLVRLAPLRRRMPSKKVTLAGREVGEGSRTRRHREHARIRRRARERSRDRRRAGRDGWSDRCPPMATVKGRTALAPHAATARAPTSATARMNLDILLILPKRAAAVDRVTRLDRGDVGTRDISRWARDVHRSDRRERYATWSGLSRIRRARGQPLGRSRMTFLGSFSSSMPL